MVWTVLAEIQLLCFLFIFLPGHRKINGSSKQKHPFMHDGLGEGSRRSYKWSILKSPIGSIWQCNAWTAFYSSYLVRHLMLPMLERSSLFYSFELTIWSKNNGKVTGQSKKNSKFSVSEPEEYFPFTESNYKLDLSTFMLRTYIFSI